MGLASPLSPPAETRPTSVPPRRWGLGRLAPLVLVLWLTLDLVLRCLPDTWFDPHPLTLATAHSGPHSYFTPNFEGVFRDWVGDAAREANLPASERRTTYHMSADSLGFRRNPFTSPTKPADVLFLLGRSFLVGAALSDDETLPAAFTRASGLGAFNGAGSNSLEDLDWLLERLPGRPWVAVLVLLEDDRGTIPAGGGPLPGRVGIHPALEPVAVALFERLNEAQWSLRQWWKVSPLETMASRLIKSVSDDRILPNEGRVGGRQLRLPDGRSMLFRRYEVQPAQAGRTDQDVERLAGYVEWWRDQLARRGMDSWVLLMPSRYTVYGPWLESGQAREGILRMEEYLNRLSRQIRRRGIHTLNALPIYRTSVEEEFETGELLFYREDNHWNARGVELIARVLADSLLSTRTSDRTTPKPPPPNQN